MACTIYQTLFIRVFITENISLEQRLKNNYQNCTNKNSCQPKKPAMKISGVLLLHLFSMTTSNNVMHQ